MPYQRTSEIDPAVRRVLPSPARAVYKAAFNNAWKRSPGDEARCHEIAWGAVHRAGFSKQGRMWRK